MKEKQKISRKRLCRSVYSTHETPQKDLLEAEIARFKTKIMKGTAINPCAYDQKTLGDYIIDSNNHISFINFPILMNDEEYVLNLAKKSLNPLDCEDYFYQFVNAYLKRKPSFRYKFMRALFLNENIYKLEDLVVIAEMLNLNPEMEKIKEDLVLKLRVIDRLTKLQNHEFEKYACSGNDPKELKQYKVSRNDEVIQIRNQIEGVKGMLKFFTCLTQEELLEKTKYTTADGWTPDFVET